MVDYHGCKEKSIHTKFGLVCLFRITERVSLRNRCVNECMDVFSTNM